MSIGFNYLFALLCNEVKEPQNRGKYTGRKWIECTLPRTRLFHPNSMHSFDFRSV